MRDALRHRGPDGGGVWSTTVRDRGVSLCHRRLKILDLSESAHQPMVGADGQVALTFNGEIYNFAEVRSQLAAAGVHVSSTGDSEVVLRAYETWGEAGIERLDGMFAIGIWDGREGRLVLARDRAGKKPLFYWTDGRSLVFGSEIKAVLAAPGVPRGLDDSRIAEYLTFGYVPNPATLFAGIQQVPPASIVTFDGAGLHGPRRYWTPLGDEAPAAAGDLGEAVRTLLDRAVRRRMVADVPLGALLSGGIDSSLVVALMARHAGEPVRTFSVGFPDAATYDERSFARIVAGHLGTRHTEFAVTLDAVGLLDRLIWHHDQPFMDSSAIPTFLVSAVAAEHVTVALNGDGADEVFGGYDRFRAAAVAPPLPASLARVASAAVARLPVDHSYHSPRNRVLRLLEQADRPVQDRYRNWIAVTGEQRLAQLLDPEVLAAGVDRVATSVEARYEEAAHLPTLDRILFANFMTYLPDDLAVKMDRMSMAHSLETRSPFLDTALIDRLAMVPARKKVGLRRLKPILRDAFAGLIPDAIFQRRKHGFGVPMGTWFRGELGTRFEDEVLAPGACTGPLVQRAAIARMYAEHRAGDLDHGNRLWTILTLERWLRTLAEPLALEPPETRLDATAVG